MVAEREASIGGRDEGPNCFGSYDDIKSRSADKDFLSSLRRRNPTRGSHEMNHPAKPAIALSNRQRMQQGRARDREIKEKTPQKSPEQPTAERAAMAGTEAAGRATRIKSVIGTLYKQNRLTGLEWAALRIYEDNASAADRSPIKSNLDRTISSGNGPVIGYETFEETETKRLEAAMGFASRTARAICIDNYTLTQWAINVFGGKEKLVKGKTVIVPIKERHVDDVLKELKLAAGRIEARD